MEITPDRGHSFKLYVRPNGPEQISADLWRQDYPCRADSHVHVAGARLPYKGDLAATEDLSLILAMLFLGGLTDDAPSWRLGAPAPLEGPRGDDSPA